MACMYSNKQFLKCSISGEYMEQIYVQTEDLSVGYHGKVLLSDIAMKVKPGEILVLIGPNGLVNQLYLRT